MKYLLLILSAPSKTTVFYYSGVFSFTVVDTYKK